MSETKCQHTPTCSVLLFSVSCISHTVLSVSHSRGTDTSPLSQLTTDFSFGNNSEVLSSVLGRAVEGRDVHLLSPITGNGASEFTLSVLKVPGGGQRLVFNECDELLPLLAKFDLLYLTLCTQAFS